MKPRQSNNSVSILFVCMGNICRSPAAEGIMRALVEQKDLQQLLSIDSCGTDSYHIGQLADARMRDAAKQRGIELTSIARQFNPKDDFDHQYILVMDDHNRQRLLQLDADKQHRDKIQHMTRFCRYHHQTEVPDPYYGGENGFDLVLDILQDACEGLLLHIVKRVNK